MTGVAGERRMQTAIEYLAQQDAASLIAMFWYLIFLEMPRYVISAQVIALSRLVDGGDLPAGDDGKPPPALSVSVLIACHNAAAKLPFAARSIAEQTIGRSQLVVIDDGSTDDIAATAEALRAEGLIDVFLSTDIRCGKAAALNLGLAHCTGDIIVTADADTSYDRDAFEMLLRRFADPAVGGVAGNLAVRNWRDNLLTRWQAIQYLISISLGRQVNAMLEILFIVSGAFGAFRREAIVTVGGWDVGPGDDSNLTAKIRRAGWRIRFAPDAWAMTDVPGDYRAFINQRLRWNRSLIRNRFRKFRTALDPRIANFSLSDALGILDALFFQTLLSIAYFVYLAWLFLTYGTFGWVILLAVTIVQVLLTLFTFLTAAAAVQRHRRLGLLPYALGYSLFISYFLRVIRVVAYLDELMFRHSYDDDFVPKRVRDRLEKF